MSDLKQAIRDAYSAMATMLDEEPPPSRHAAAWEWLQEHRDDLVMAGVLIWGLTGFVLLALLTLGH